MAFIQIGTKKDFLTGQIKEIDLKGQKIIVVENENQLKAFQGTCPHQGASLVDSSLENGHLVCPMHQYAFSCTTGKHSNSELCLQEFPLKIDGENVFIELSSETKKTKGFTKKIADLPSPKGQLLVGHLPQFKPEIKHLVLERWVKEVGNLFKFHLLGKQFVVSADAEFNELVLKSRPKSFRRYSKIQEIMEEMGIYGVFNSEGETWAKQRKITAEALNLKNVKAYFPTISELTEKLYKRWLILSEQGASLDVQQELMRYTVDVTTLIAFGYNTNTLEKEGDVIQQQLEKIFPAINKRITSPIPLWRLYKTKEDKELDQSIKSIETVIYDFISKAKIRLAENPERKEKPSNFLEALLVAQEQEGRVSDKEIYGNVFTILLAGEDTTSNSISWALYYLATHPEKYVKAKEEANRVLGDAVCATDVNQLEDLKYIEAVVLEAMRLKPVTPTLIATATEDVVIKDLFIPTGTDLILQNKIPQTSEENFVRADEFIPERWLATKCPVIGNHTPDVMRAFGAGSRFCPGKHLALHEMISAVSMICHNFDFELAVKVGEVKERYAFTMFPQNLMMNVKATSVVLK